MTALTFKDFETDQEVRWCPGCGDYSILKAVQRALADAGADVHLRDRSGRTPLMTACAGDVVRALLGRGAVLDVRDNAERTISSAQSTRLPSSSKSRLTRKLA